MAVYAAKSVYLSRRWVSIFIGYFPLILENLASNIVQVHKYKEKFVLVYLYDSDLTSNNKQVRQVIYHWTNVPCCALSVRRPLSLAPPVSPRAYLRRSTAESFKLQEQYYEWKFESFNGRYFKVNNAEFFAFDISNRT